MIALYALTIFTGASLLFLVQPMFARMVLPLLGGAPAVWNTALVFYQATLLAGYAYAHLTARWLGAGRQAALQLGLLLIPLLVLPIRLPAGWAPPVQSSPTLWLLALLAVIVGPPFFVVSATSPLLQRWLTQTRHGAAADPYFLYGASNLGSMLALLAYPALFEPYLTLGDQSVVWTVGYVLLIVLTAGCAAILWRAPASEPTGRRDPALGLGTDEPSPSRARCARWVLLGFVPSSLMLSVTTYLSTDIAAIPLLWVIPLALYLLTFILVFARRPPIPHHVMTAVLPLVMLPLVLVLAARANEPLGLVMTTHLVAFFVASMVCHGELARDRPAPRHLTSFYLWLSLGGVLGGAFTALGAPLVFDRVVEYPLMLVAACLVPSLAAPVAASRSSRLLDLAVPAALGVAALALIRMLATGDPATAAARAGLVFGVLVFACLFSARRPVRFGLGIGAILLASSLYEGAEGRLLLQQRSFFGIHRVTIDRPARHHILLHGTTLHGMQSLDPARRREPLTYFHADGPLGQLFRAVGGTRGRVAVVGLGAGSLACHAQPGQRWTFYEIDPVVERIARDRRFFTFLADCQPEAPVVLGDARLSLAGAPDGAYTLLILDAYSSDAPPVHLITREALALYLRKLAPGGILAFNISNRHLDLEPVLGRLAADARLTALTQDDDVSGAGTTGKLPSQWMIMARSPADFGPLGQDPRWQPPGVDPGAVWTDSFSSLLSVFRWR